MGLRLNMASTLLLMVLTTCICTQAALLGKSSAADFLSHGQREKRSMEDSTEDSDGESNSEAEELLVNHPDYAAGFPTQLNGGSQPGIYLSPDSEALKEDGSGM